MAKPTLLMCPPDHFEVVYTINPWMDPEGWASHDEEWKHDAEGQWNALRQTFEALGAKIALAPAQAGWPDMVFTANAGICLDGRVLVARFRHPERQGEEAFFTEQFEQMREHGILREVAALPEGLIQEGEGDCLWDAHRNLFWSGHGQRSALEANGAIAQFFGREAVSLELIDPRYYHLDVCLAPLVTGHILYYPGAFSDAARATLEERVGADYLVPVEKVDADRMALNAVSLGHDIVMNDCSADLEGRLGALGFKVHRVPLPAFLKAGGSANCLSMRLDN